MGLPGGPETAQISPKLQFCQDFTQICWDIFLKLPLNSMLIAITVPLKLFFFKYCFGLSNGPENGPKLAQNALFPYFSELFCVFLLRHSSNQYIESFPMSHGLKFPAKLQISIVYLLNC